MNPISFFSLRPFIVLLAIAFAATSASAQTEGSKLDQIAAYDSSQHDFGSPFTWKVPENYDSILSAMDTRTLLDHVILYPEIYRQTCGVRFGPSLELSSPRGDRIASRRQIDALMKNRDSVIIYLSELPRGSLFRNVLNLIDDLGATESIPNLLKVLEAQPFDTANQADNPFMFADPNEGIASTILALLDRDDFRVQSSDDRSALELDAYLDEILLEDDDNVSRYGWPYSIHAERVVIALARGYTGCAECREEKVLPQIDLK